MVTLRQSYCDHLLAMAGCRCELRGTWRENPPVLSSTSLVRSTSTMRASRRAALALLPPTRFMCCRSAPKLQSMRARESSIFGSGKKSITQYEPGNFVHHLQTASVVKTMPPEPQSQKINVDSHYQQLWLSWHSRLSQQAHAIKIGKTFCHQWGYDPHHQSLTPVKKTESCIRCFRCTSLDKDWMS